MVLLIQDICCAKIFLRTIDMLSFADFTVDKIKIWYFFPKMLDKTSQQIEKRQKGEKPRHIYLGIQQDYRTYI